MNALQILALYPKGSIQLTGGNCTAWIHPYGEGGHMMVTVTDDACAPTEEDLEVAVGLYNADAEMITDDCDIVDVAQLEVHLDAVLGADAKRPAHAVMRHIYGSTNCLCDVCATDRLRAQAVDRRLIPTVIKELELIKSRFPVSTKEWKAIESARFALSEVV
jgi:hypothetical protein